MTAQVLEFRPRTQRGPAPVIRTRLPEPRIVPAVSPFWHCPAWCDTCTGGEQFDFDDGNGLGAATSRSHRGTVHAEQVIDLDGDHVEARVELIAIEDPDLGFVDGAFVAVQADVTTPDLDALARIRDAIDAAIDHARRPLPATSTRSPSEGGDRASTPREAS